MFRWYVVNTYSGHENKVKHNLEHRVVSLGQQRAIPGGEVVNDFQHRRAFVSRSSLARQDCDLTEIARSLRAGDSGYSV